MNYIVLNLGRMVTICESTNIERIRALYLNDWKLVGEANSLELARSIWEQYSSRYGNR
jgi:hypothetical protein